MIFVMVNLIYIHIFICIIGQCLCKDNVEGLHCDHCSENYYNLKESCQPCDDCYSLIQDRKNSINKSMSILRNHLDDFNTSPVSVIFKILFILFLD